MYEMLGVIGAFALIYFMMLLLCRMIEKRWFWSWPTEMLKDLLNVNRT